MERQRLVLILERAQLSLLGAIVEGLLGS